MGCYLGVSAVRFAVTDIYRRGDQRTVKVSCLSLRGHRERQIRRERREVTVSEIFFSSVAPEAKSFHGVLLLMKRVDLRGDT